MSLNRNIQRTRFCIDWLKNILWPEAQRDPFLCFYKKWWSQRYYNNSTFAITSGKTAAMNNDNQLHLPNTSLLIRYKSPGRQAGSQWKGNYQGEEMKEAGPMVRKVLLLLNYPWFTCIKGEEVPEDYSNWARLFKSWKYQHFQGEIQSVQIAPVSNSYKQKERGGFHLPMWVWSV